MRICSAISGMTAILRVLGGFPHARFDDTLSGLLLYDGGVDSAYENYALLLPDALPCDPREREQLVCAGLRFFAEGSREHIWPLFPGLPDDIHIFLEREGARVDDHFCGMAASISSIRENAPGETPFAVRWIKKEEGAAEWANAAWYGFDSGEAAPEPFKALVRACVVCDDLHLLGLSDPETGVVAATGMLCTHDAVAGIYYVSTLPLHRRRGLGKQVMHLLAARAKEMGFDGVSLVATPAGRPLYEECGFVDLEDIPIRLAP